MFNKLAESDRLEKIEKVANLLGKQSTSKSHSRHISYDVASEIGLDVKRLEDDQELQNAVLTLHHALSITFAQTPSYKIIENQNGVAYIQQAQMGLAKA
jgi:hypothetical protein